MASWSHTGTPRPKLGNHRHALDQVHAGSSQGQAEDGHSKSWVYWVCGMLMNILLGPLLDVAGKTLNNNQKKTTCDCSSESVARNSVQESLW